MVGVFCDLVKESDLTHGILCDARAPENVEAE
jgi:hypothetical protein